MPKYFDTRDFNFTRPSNSEEAAATLSATLPGAYELRVRRVNPFTGSPVCLRSINAGGDAARSSAEALTDRELIVRALEHLRMTAPALGYDTWEKPEFIPDPHVKKTSAGVRIVSLQQHHQGIPIFQMERVVSFDYTGTIRDVSGRSVSGLPSNLETLPVVTVEAAMAAAVSYLSEPEMSTNPWTKQEQARPALGLGSYQPRVLSKSANPAQTLVLDRGHFGEITPAHLVFFYQGATTRLGWHLLISLPELNEQYVVIIEADSQTADRRKPQPLYCRKTSCEAGAPARGNVWTQNPGMNAVRQMVDFPRPLTDYPIAPSTALPQDFPPSWVNTPTTSGNNVVVFFNQGGNFITAGTPIGGVFTFSAEPEQGARQIVLNAFYFCNFMHDFFYLLGFDEAAGNFQTVNLTGQGVPGDNLIVMVLSGPIPQTAVMITQADGAQGIMKLGSVDDRHCALDSDMVFHEYTHGVSNRRVGRRGDAFPLQMPQSAALGEGWSDYFALTIQNCFFDQGKTSFGDWIFNTPPGTGARLAPYDDNYPATFSNLGQPGPYNGDDVHATGEIWCAALMKMNRDLVREFGDKRRGHLLGWRIVFDGFSETPANPSFLQARDGIINALNAHQQTGALSQSEFQTARRVAWESFARFGMGQNARCRDASLEGIIEDRNPPPGL